MEQKKITIPAGLLIEALSIAEEAVTGLKIAADDEPEFEVSHEFLRQLLDFAEHHPEQDVRNFIQAEIGFYLKEG